MINIILSIRNRNRRMKELKMRRWLMKTNCLISNARHWLNCSVPVSYFCHSCTSLSFFSLFALLSIYLYPISIFHIRKTKPCFLNMNQFSATLLGVRTRRDRAGFVLASLIATLLVAAVACCCDVRTLFIQFDTLQVLLTSSRTRYCFLRCTTRLLSALSS